MSSTGFLISPVAPEPAVSTVTKGGQRPPLARALRLGVLDNGKGNADHLLRFVTAGVKELVPVAEVVWLRKSSMSHPAPHEMLDKLAAEVDFVVSAIAD